MKVKIQNLLKKKLQLPKLKLNQRLLQQQVLHQGVLHLEQLQEQHLLTQRQMPLLLRVPKALHHLEVVDLVDQIKYQLRRVKPFIYFLRINMNKSLIYFFPSLIE